VRFYLNGRLVNFGEAGISPLDAGFLLGWGVFETMRACGGKVFRLKRHLDRLAEGCRRLGIGPVPKASDLQVAVYATLRTNALTAARLRLTVTAGNESVPGAGVPAAPPTVVVTAFPLSETARPRPWTAGTSSRPVFSGDLLLSVKTTSRAGHTLARREARAAGYDEALLVNERGVYTEGSVSNLFLVRERVVITPPVSDGLLPGITREVVSELAPGLGLKLQEQSVSADDLLFADEAFLTNAVVGLVPLAALDGHPIGARVPGPVTVSLRSAYAALITAEATLGDGAHLTTPDGPDVIK